jgi:hypothetical protein
MGPDFCSPRLSDRRHQGWGANMDKIKVIHDTTGHTLTVWFDDIGRRTP